MASRLTVKKQALPLSRRKITRIFLIIVRMYSTQHDNLIDIFLHAGLKSNRFHRVIYCSGDFNV